MLLTTAEILGGCRHQVIKLEIVRTWRRRVVQLSLSVLLGIQVLIYTEGQLCLASCWLDRLGLERRRRLPIPTLRWLRAMHLTPAAHREAPVVRRRCLRKDGVDIALVVNLPFAVEVLVHVRVVRTHSFLVRLLLLVVVAHCLHEVFAHVLLHELLL